MSETPLALDPLDLEAVAEAIYRLFVSTGASWDQESDYYKSCFYPRVEKVLAARALASSPPQPAPQPATLGRRDLDLTPLFAMVHRLINRYGEEYGQKAELQAALNTISSEVARLRGAPPQEPAAPAVVGVVELLKAYTATLSNKGRDSWHLTDREMAETFVENFEDWLDKNPPPPAPSQPQEAGDAPADWTDRVIQALAACSKQIERRGVIEGSADQGPAERAHMAGCKWLGKYLAVPPVPQAGPALLETPWMQEDFKRLHALHPWPTPEHDALVRIFMAIKGLQAPASPEGKAGTAQAPDLEALEAYFAAVVAGGDPPGQEIAAKAWLTEIRRLRSQGEAPQGRLWEPVVGSEAIAPALDAAGVGEPAPGEPSKWAKTDSAPPRDPKDGLVFGYVNPTQAEPSKDLPVFYYKEESNPPMKHRYSDPTPTKPQGEA